MALYGRCLWNTLNRCRRRSQEATKFRGAPWDFADRAVIRWWVFGEGLATMPDTTNLQVPCQKTLPMLCLPAIEHPNAYEVAPGRRVQGCYQIDKGLADSLPLLLGMISPASCVTGPPSE